MHELGVLFPSSCGVVFFFFLSVDSIPYEEGGINMLDFYHISSLNVH